MNTLKSAFKRFWASLVYMPSDAVRGCEEYGAVEDAEVAPCPDVTVAGLDGQELAGAA